MAEGMGKAQDRIIANRLTLIQHRAPALEYTHVTSIRTDEQFLYIMGETDDAFGMRKQVFDKFLHQHVAFMLVKWS